MTGSRWTRRQFLAASLLAAHARSQCPAPEVRTPYKYGRLVLGASPEPDAFDSRSVDCPFVFYHDGRYWMTYVGFDGYGYQTGLASSEDLIHWEKHGCIVPRNPKSEIAQFSVALNWILRENELRSPGRLRKVNGKYLGAYHAYPKPGYEQGPASIGLCWSEDLFHWSLEPPVLRPEDGAEWERGGLYKPCLLEHEGTFYLIYNAKNDVPRGWREQTGVAWSKDLKTWERYAGNPILRNGPPGSPDERFASDPCVLRSGDLWLIFYYGLDARGKARDLLAVSPDLLHVTKCDEVLIDVGPPGSIDETYAHKPSVVFDGRCLYHFYCAVSYRDKKETRGISVARSCPWE